VRLATILTVMFLAFAAWPGKGGAAGAVDTAVVLAADVSQSIDSEEFGLQRRGYAAAITSARLLRRSALARTAQSRFASSNGPARRSRRS
jgi:hypothetical protein